MEKKCSIIITDDDKDDQEFLIKAIKQAGIKCEIETTYDGEELMTMLKEKSGKQNKKLPDLIILDLNMPLMDGYEVLKELKRSSELKHIPVYILTTSEFEFDKIKSIAYGAKKFYSKPLIYTDLIKIVQDMLSSELQLC